MSYLNMDTYKHTFRVSGITDAGLIGMALAYALNLMGLFQYSIRQSAEVEGMVCLSVAYNY